MCLPRRLEEYILGAEMKPWLNIFGILSHQLIANALLVTQIFVALIPEFFLKADTKQ
jgi:hypothetical protein